MGTNEWLCRYLPASLRRRCEFHVRQYIFCVLPQIYGADLARSGWWGGRGRGRVVRLGGTLPSLQSSPAGTEANLRQRPAEQLCLNSVALYYPT